MACMITSCAGLKPDEIVKADTSDTTSSTGTDNSKDSQPKKQDELVKNTASDNTAKPSKDNPGGTQPKEKQKQNKNRDEQENKEDFFDAWTTIYYAGAAGVIVAVGIIMAVTCYCNKPVYDITATIKTELTVQQILEKLKGKGKGKGITFNLTIDSDISTDYFGRKNKGYELYLGKNNRIHILDRNFAWSNLLADIHTELTPQGMLDSFLASIEDKKPVASAEKKLLLSPTTVKLIRTKHTGTLEITSDNQENISFLEKLIELNATKVSGNAILLLLEALLKALVKLIFVDLV